LPQLNIALCSHQCCLLAGPAIATIHLLLITCSSSSVIARPIQFVSGVESLRLSVYTFRANFFWSICLALTTCASFLYSCRSATFSFSANWCTLIKTRGRGWYPRLQLFN